MNKFEIGQCVWLYDINSRSGPIEVEVIKVGRTLVTVKYFGRPIQFRIENGYWSDRDFPHHKYIRTAEERDAKDRRNNVESALHKAGVRWNHEREMYSTEQLEAVLAVLKP